MKITAKALREKGACPEQVELFVSEWPEGGEVTEAGLLRAAKIGLDMGWFARHFLPSPLWAEYERQDAPLWAEYDRQDASLLAEYLRQRAPILAEYKRQNAALWAEYERQRAPLWEEYKRQNALLIWRLLKDK